MMRAASLLLLLLLLLSVAAGALAPGDSCDAGTTACVCDPDTLVCCAPGQPQPCFAGDVPQVDACEVIQVHAGLSSDNPSYYQILESSTSPGSPFSEMWSTAHACNPAWRSHRFVDVVFTIDKAHNDAGCAGPRPYAAFQQEGKYGIINMTSADYGQCYVGYATFEVCPDHYVCRDGACLTSCVTDDDCYVYEPWNDVSCPYARCEGGACVRHTDGAKGTSPSCPADDAPACTLPLPPKPQGPPAPASGGARAAPGALAWAALAALAARAGVQ